MSCVAPGRAVFHCGFWGFLFCGEVFPNACLCITVDPTHASVLLSSPTQGHSGALYLSRPAWCFSNMPSCFHHSTVQFLIPTEFYFHTSKRYIPLKKTKKKKNPCLASCVVSFFWMDPGAQWGHFNDPFKSLPPKSVSSLSILYSRFTSHPVFPGLNVARELGFTASCCRLDKLLVSKVNCARGCGRSVV